MTMTNKPKAATVQDVARFANVSTATVSRALSAPDSVSARKREAVLAAVEATGYRVNRAARNLRTQRSNTILALLPDLGNPFFSLVLQGIVDVLTPAGQSLVVAETSQIYSAGDDLLSYLSSKRVDGMIVLDGAVSQESLDHVLASDQKSRVVFACEWAPLGGFPSVRSNNLGGAMQAVDFLYASGHRQIAHISGPTNNVLTQARIAGYEKACEEHQLIPQCIEGDFTLEAGIKAAEAILAMSDRPTAVFCASDVIAYGLISGLSRAGVNVPDEVSVVGFDDIEYSEHFVPALTTVRQDRVALGQAAAHMLLNAEAASDQDLLQKIPVHLIERSSTAAAKVANPV